LRWKALTEEKAIVDEETKEQLKALGYTTD
jgi:hypothetical protein